MDSTFYDDVAAECKPQQSIRTDLSIIDEEFVYKVQYDIKLFVKRRPNQSVLLFPPVNNFRRFLIHHTCENFRIKYDLCTFSVGHGTNRRTVVAFKNQLLPMQTIKRKELDMHNAEAREALKNNSLDTWESNSRPQTMDAKKTKTDIRPSKTNEIHIYRPPPLRNSMEIPTATTPSCNELLTGYRSNAIKTGNLHSFSVPQTKSCVSHSKNSGTKANAVMTLMAGNTKKNNKQQDNKTTTVVESNVSPTTTTTTNGQTDIINQTKESMKQAYVRRERRPDRAVYIPRARRSQTLPPAAVTTTTATPTTSTTQKLANNNITIATTSAHAPTVVEKASLQRADENRGCQIEMAKITSVVATTKFTAMNLTNKLERELEAETAVADKFSIEKNRLISINKMQNLNDIRNEIQLTNNCDKNYELTTTATTSRKSNAVNGEQKSVATLKKAETTSNTNIYNNINNNDTNNQMNAQLNENINISYNNNNNTTTTTNPVNNHNNFNNNHNNNASNSTPCIEDIAKNKCENIEEQELKRASKEINRSNRRIMKQSFVSDVLEIPDKLPITQNVNNHIESSTATTPKLNQKLQIKVKETSEDDNEHEHEQDDWDTMYDESGECLDPKLVQEITDTVGKVKLDLPEMDYSMYLSKQKLLEKENFPHVLEVSNFPAEFKHQDLLMVFSQYKESGFAIKWVDDTHALAVFSSSRIAAEVLTMGHPFVVVKPLAEATPESRTKAKKCANSLQPYRQRPETCAALARRLVTGALGVRLKTTAEERENEKRVLKQAKERKLMAAKQRDETWDN